MATNKVHFGLKNVHYAVLTEGSPNSWATPVPILGVVSLDLSAEGERNDFFADNMTYYSSISNNGYSGTLEVAKLPETMLSDVFGQTSDANGIAEYANVEPAPFALLFQLDGDNHEDYYVFYRVLANRPPVTTETIGETKEPQTVSLDVRCLPLVTGDEAGLVKYRTKETTPTATKEAWFTAVQLPV